MRQNCVALKYVEDDGNMTMGYPMNPNRLVGLTSPDSLHVFHLDMDNAEEPMKRSMICKERLFVATIVGQGITACSNKQDNEARYLLMSTLIYGRRRC